MRAVGTGTHPEGRYLKGQVFDLPEVQAGASDTAGVPDISAVHPDYRSIIENGWAKLLDPLDDPGRTDSQIAHSIVRGDDLSHPLDAEKAEEIGPEQALAIVHTDDPEATEVPDPHEDRGSTVGHRGRQHSISPTGARPGAADDLDEGEATAGSSSSSSTAANAPTRTTRPSQRKAAGSRSGGRKASSRSGGGSGGTQAAAGTPGEDATASGAAGTSTGDGKQ